MLRYVVIVIITLIVFALITLAQNMYLKKESKQPKEVEKMANWGAMISAVVIVASALTLAVMAFTYWQTKKKLSTV